MGESDFDFKLIAVSLVFAMGVILFVFSIASEVFSKLLWISLLMMLVSGLGIISIIRG